MSAVISSLSSVERENSVEWLHSRFHFYTFFPLKLRVIMHVALLIVFYTNTPPLSTSRTGSLHDCPWLRVNKPWPHTLPLSAVWFPIGQPVDSILLRLCFHQHGAQTTLSFPHQTSTNTLCPLYCPEPNITSLITIKSLYQQSGMPSSLPGQKSRIPSSLTLMEDNTVVN